MNYMIEKAKNIKEQINNLARNAEDITALASMDLYDEFFVGKKYEVGDRFVYKETMYKVLQSHTSQEDWIPDNTPSLYAEVLIPDDDKIYDWKQPESTNGYMKGNLVMHNGKKWESLVDNNVWEPGAVGTETLWKLIEWHF